MTTLRLSPWFGVLALLITRSALADNVTVAAPSKPFNPDTSANFLGLYQRKIHATENGFSLQEAEVQFVSDVDPYFKANILLSVSQATPGGEFGIDPEEVFLESTSIKSFTIKAGKFKAAFGKHNTLHTHAYPFIDAPLINQALLGDEGLNEAGVSATYLMPLPWFGELTAQAITNGNEPIFNSGNVGAMTGVFQVRNLWDLTDDLTMDWSIFDATGKNRYSATTNAFGTDLIFKWRPSVGGKYHALIWQSEYLNGNTANNPNGTTRGGLATWLQYQFAERWWVQGRAEFVGLPKADDFPKSQKQTVLLGFFPSEFSGFRVQYAHLTTTDLPVDHQVALQWNVSIGAHPAHAY